MYAIVDAGGHQLKVRAGQVLDIDRRELAPGAAIEFDRVLLLADGASVTVGQPTIPGAKVRATVLREVKGEKIVVFKYRAKVRYRRRLGHRQRYTRVRIDSIEGGSHGA